MTDVTAVLGIVAAVFAAILAIVGDTLSFMVSNPITLVGFATSIGLLGFKLVKRFI